MADKSTRHALVQHEQAWCLGHAVARSSKERAQPGERNNTDKAEHVVVRNYCGRSGECVLQHGASGFRRENERSSHKYKHCIQVEARCGERRMLGVCVRLCSRFQQCATPL